MGPVETSPTPPAEPATPDCLTLEPVHREDGTVDWTATRVKVQEAYAIAPADDLGTPAWQTAYNQLWASEQERELLERMGALDARVQETDIPGTNVAEWTPGFRGSPGFLVDEEQALSTPCRRINLGEGRRPLVYSKGIIGALDGDQIARYCATFVDEEPSPRQRERLVVMSEAAHSCSLSTKDAPPDQHLDLYFTCLGKELKARGVEP